MLTSSRFTFMNLANIQPERKVEIVIVFKAQNIRLLRTLPIRSQNLSPQLLLQMVQRTQRENINKVSLDRLVMKFVKNDRQFVAFEKLNQEQYVSLLSRDSIQIEYLYRDKRDQVAKRISRFENQVLQKHAYLMEISKDQNTKIDLLKRWASKKSGLSQSTSVQIKIKITLFISDPLVRNKSIPVGHQQIDIEQHIKVLKQASNAQKSLTIHVDKHHAIESHITTVFGDEVASSGQQKKAIRIVHFFTTVFKKNDELFIVFEDKKNAFGQEKLVSVKQFFQKIQKSSIHLLIFIGNNVNLLNQQIKSKSLQFSILLLSTYNPNTQETFLFFLKTFYEQLFDRNQIGKAVSIAYQEYKKTIIDSDAWKNNIVCCCLHEHQESCAWTKIVERTGLRLGHKLFSHKNIKSTALKSLNTQLQTVLLHELGVQTFKCSTLQDACCQQSHVKKSLIMETKIIAFVSQFSHNIFGVSQNFRDFVKNEIHIKMHYEKISPIRRSPLIIYEIVKKILSNKGKIIQMGSRRVGKSHFIQAACKYIQNRKRNYEFQNIDLIQGSLRECIKYMHSKAEKHKNEKKIVFIYQNNELLIEKEYIRHFKQKKSNNNQLLPYTFIIKAQEDQNSLIQNEEPSQSKNRAYITIPRPRKFDIICEIYHELPEHYLEENKNLEDILKFAQNFDNQLTYRIIRNFLKYFNQKQQQSKIRKGKSLVYVYNQMSKEFFNRIEQVQTSNKSFFKFLGFLSQFPEGIYLTKFNQLLLKDVFGIDDLKTIMKNKENVNYFFQVIQKANFVKAVNIKSQKIDFVVPEQKVINYFKHDLKLQGLFHKMKVSFFNYFFTVIETLIFDNMHVVGNRLKKQRVFLDEGIFLFNSRKSKQTHEENQEQKIVRKLVKDVQNLYSSQVDLKILYQNESKQKLSSLRLNEPNAKLILLKQKTISIILHESQRYVLHRHLSNLCGIISLTNKKKSHVHKQASENPANEAPNQHHQGHAGKCPVLFYKKMYLVFRLLLKQPQKYEQLKTKLQNIEPKLIEYYQTKGSQMLTELIEEQQRQNANKKGHIKFARSHKSFHFLGTQNVDKQKKQHQKNHKVSAQSYFSKLINFLQLQILINRKETFSLSFNEFGAKRKSGNQLNKDRAKIQKSCFEKRLESLLPKIKKQMKSEQLISITLAQSSKLAQNTFLWAKPSQYKFLCNQQLIILIIHKLLLYECEQQYINYFYDLEEILGIIDREIKFFQAIIELYKEIEVRKVSQNLDERYGFLSCINKEELTMQILRLHMRKVEIHFRLKKDRKNLVSSSKVEQNIERLIDLKSFEYLQTYCKVLQSSYSDPKNMYFCNQKVHRFLKNAEICQKYIHSVCENDKVTQEFTTLIGEVDNNYKEMFSYLCEQAWKKMLFNQSNNIIFFKSRVIAFKDKPYVYVRKRNVTMKYVKKMLSDIKINISFLHLTRNNFNYIQIDKKQNPNCKIKYLVLTVDSEIINNEICLIFQHHNNITHDLVRLETFLDMMNMVNVEFIIIMGKKALKLAEAMSKYLKSNPIIIGFENSNPDFGLDNYVEYIDDNNSVIAEEDEFLPNDKLSDTESLMVRQIYKYLDIQCFHTLLDMIVCTLVTNFVQITQQKTKMNRRASYQTQSYVVSSYRKIKEIVIKSINMAKEIIRNKWQSAKQIEVIYEIFPINNDPQSSTNISVLRKNYSVTLHESSQMPLANKYSARQQQDLVRYFPHFEKGIVTDNTIKLYESPLNLQDEEYYENVNRNHQLFSIMSFIQCEGRRIVEIFGGSGSGKSSFLRQICWINQTYRLFKDGVYMFDAQTLLKNSQTLLWHIQIFYKDHKLFSILEQDFTVQKSDPSTIIIALDNLDSESIRDNHDFFERLKGKPICLIYSTKSLNFSSELKNYISIELVNTQNARGRHMSSHDSINPHVVHSFSQRHLVPQHQSHHHLHHSLSNQFEKKKNDDYFIKQFSSQTAEEVWNFLHIDIRSVSKNALFNIALSFLKKEEFATLKVGMKDFIKKNFSVFLIQLFSQLFYDDVCLPKSFSIKGSRTYSASESFSEQEIARIDEQQVMQEPQALQKIQSQIPANSLQLHQQKNGQGQGSTVQKLIKRLEEYFRTLSEQKVSLSISSVSTSNSEVQKVTLIGNLTKNILGQKKDSRLWFYEDCFEQLMVMNNTYDQMRVFFK